MDTGIRKHPHSILYGIEAERFIGAVLIICHHLTHFQSISYFAGGWIFVEFFFMLTGYFSVAHFERGGKQLSGKRYFGIHVEKRKTIFPICMCIRYIKLLI